VDDDAQVVELRVTKRHAEADGIRVGIQAA
jgi:Holliday junction resolvase RusA-like endonuclease